jgi:hypothetical protein
MHTLHAFTQKWLQNFYETQDPAKAAQQGILLPQHAAYKTFTPTVLGIAAGAATATLENVLIAVASALHAMSVGSRACALPCLCCLPQ